MVHRENFVVAIKNNGKILREILSNTVYLPFGSEYSVLLKNLNSVSAVVDVDIDGVNAAKGIIIRPNSNLELEGFLEGFAVRNRFKFIEKTQEISDYRGDRIDDGIVRVEYRFEKKYQPFSHNDIIWHHFSSDNMPYRNTTVYCCANTDGITVKGSDTKQDFNVGYTNTLEDTSFVISLTLKGTMSGNPIQKPLTIKTHIQCPTCGRSFGSSVKFCSNCGTRLI
jgi:hypothetical protein